VINDASTNVTNAIQIKVDESVRVVTGGPSGMGS
jgi:hypothetical protein